MILGIRARGILRPAVEAFTPFRKALVKRISPGGDAGPERLEKRAQEGRRHVWPVIHVLIERALTQTRPPVDEPDEIDIEHQPCARPPARDLRIKNGRSNERTRAGFLSSSYPR